MIEITYGHKKEYDTHTVSKLTIGHGLPTWGQLDFISLITEEIGADGLVGFARYRWGFGFWRVKEFIKAWLKSRQTTR